MIKQDNKCLKNFLSILLYIMLLIIILYFTKNEKFSLIIIFQLAKGDRLKEKSKKDPKIIIKQHNRGRIRDYIETHPGTTQKMMKKNLNLESGVLLHHLEILEKFGYIKSKYDYDYNPKFKRYFPIGEIKNPFVEIELTQIRQKIIKTIEKYPGIWPGKIAKHIGEKRQKVDYHIPILETMGKIRIEKENGKSKCYLQNIKK